MAKKTSKVETKKSSIFKRKRAHKPDGKFVADDPSTPENEAFVAVGVTSVDMVKMREDQRVNSVTNSSQRRLGGKLIA